MAPKTTNTSISSTFMYQWQSIRVILFFLYPSLVLTCSLWCLFFSRIWPTATVGTMKHGACCQLLPKMRQRRVSCCQVLQVFSSKVRNVLNRCNCRLSVPGFLVHYLIFLRKGILGGGGRQKCVYFFFQQSCNMEDGSVWLCRVQ